MEATPKSEGAKPAGAPEGEDLSMEEILQSIRRIIAEEGDESGKPAGSDEVPGSAVLELTEMVQDDGSVVSVKPAETPPAKETPKEPASGDVLSKIDQALGSDKPKAAEPAAAPAAPAKVEEPPKPAPAAAKPPEPVAAAPAPPKPAEPKTAAPAAPAAPAPSADSLLSSAAATTAVASFNKLKVEEELPPVVTTPSPEFRSGNTVEDMVMAMLRPMMKEWLDANLPAIVERIVEREVKRLTK